jgi:multiple antibiotic resistance protein
VLRAFVAIFVVMNVLPLLPLVAHMTRHLDQAARRVLLKDAMLIGAGVAVLTVLGGPLLFSYIGITIHDLRMGGGIVLLVFVTYDLLFSMRQRKEQDVGQDVGSVPLGVPILVGPATLATLLVMSDVHGRLPILIVLAVNLAINWFLVQNAQQIVQMLGESLTHALGKLYALFLAAIAVSMMRNGIYGAIDGFDAMH